MSVPSDQRAINDRDDATEAAVSLDDLEDVNVSTSAGNDESHVGAVNVALESDISTPKATLVEEPTTPTVSTTTYVAERGLWGSELVKRFGEPTPFAAVVLQALVSLICSGIVYGWPAVVFMLNSEGIYSELCASSGTPASALPHDIHCAARNLKYATIYNIGVAMSVASYLWYGVSVDKLGPLYTNMISTSVAAAGCLLFGISSPERPYYTLAYALIGGSGVGVHLSSFHLGNPFPTNKGLILSMYAGIFNVSGIIFAIFSLLYSSAGFSMRSLFVGHAFLIVAASLIVPWYQTKRSTPASPPPAPAPASAAVSPAQNSSFMTILTQFGKSPVPKYAHLDDYLAQVKQPLFFYIILWVVIHLVRIAFYAGTVTSQMSYFGDSDQTYAKIAAWTIPLVPLVTFPIVGRIMDKFGILVALPLANVFQIVFGFLSLIPILPLQMFTFISYALGRQFFFGTYFALVIQIFGQKNFGKISGTALFVAGVCVVAQTPLIKVIDKTLNGNFALVNLLETLIFVPLLHFPIYLWKKGTANPSNAK